MGADDLVPGYVIEDGGLGPDNATAEIASPADYGSYLITLKPQRVGRFSIGVNAGALRDIWSAIREGGDNRHGMDGGSLRDGASA